MGTEALDCGRMAFVAQAWRDASAQLSAADHQQALGPADLDRLATALYLVGEETDATNVWARAYHESVGRGEFDRAARCGFWLSHNLLLAGDAAQSRGWLARTERLLDDEQTDCVECGYLLLVSGLYDMGAGDAAASYATNCEVAEIADRFGDAELVTLSLLCRGKALLELGGIAEAMSLLDEAMVAVAAQEASPIVTGIVYCAAILACRSIRDLNRAREWTAALSSWCTSQPDLVPFRGQCLVHRSEIMQLCGDWAGAMSEAQRACEQLSKPRQPAQALGFYQLADMHRLRGAFAEAEEAYRQASQSGLEPQPGLSQLRLAQGRVDQAAAAIRRVTDEAKDTVSRSRLLGPYVEIILAAGDVAAARSAAGELEKIAAELDTPVLHAISACATGTVSLSEGDIAAALAALRQAWALWRELEAPYEAARVRVELARACRELGDHDTAELHAEAARSAFRRLAAAPDSARIADLTLSGPGPEDLLTARERQVLGLTAAGKSNHAIAEDLVVSEKTVERHLSNVFTKLGVSSRTAAAAYAYQHHLI